MVTHPFNPRAEKEALSNAIGVFRARWEQQRTIDAVCELCDAIERADAVCAELRKCPLAPQSALALVHMYLQLLLALARHELIRGQGETLEEIGQRIAAEEHQLASAPSAVLSAGTILSCPQCEERLYKAHHACEYRGARAG